MPELLAHLIGDYCLQNHWMALNKTKQWGAAALHALFYGLPFLFLGVDRYQWAMIVGTHLLIDRFRLAKYWVDFWGVGTMGRVVETAYQLEGYVWVRGFAKDDVHLLPENWVMTLPVNTTEAQTWIEQNRADFPDAPPFLAVWLVIIVDNTMHLCINHWALTW